MALTSGQQKRSGHVTDADGREFDVDVGGIADAVSATATAAAPAAAATLVTVAATSGFIYRVRAVLVLTGTAETQLINAQFRNNAVFHSALPAITGQVIVMEWQRITAAGNLSLTVPANATAGSIYTASLTATRVE